MSKNLLETYRDMHQLEEARIPNYKPTKFEGKEFDRKKEIKSLKTMQKAIHKVAKMQDNMQFTAETGGSASRGNPHAIYQSLVNAEQQYLITWVVSKEDITMVSSIWTEINGQSRRKIQNF